MSASRDGHLKVPADRVLHAGDREAAAGDQVARWEQVLQRFPRAVRARHDGFEYGCLRLAESQLSSATLSGLIGALLARESGCPPESRAYRPQGL